MYALVGLEGIVSESDGGFLVEGLNFTILPFKKRKIKRGFLIKISLLGAKAIPAVDQKTF